MAAKSCHTLVTETTSVNALAEAHYFLPAFCITATSTLTHLRMLHLRSKGINPALDCVVDLVNDRLRSNLVC